MLYSTLRNSPSWQTILRCFLPLLCFFSLLSLCFAGSLRFTFQPPQINPTKIKLWGDAFTRMGKIELTKDQVRDNLMDSRGCATYIDSVPLWENSSKTLANLTTYFRFIIANARSNLTGDGLTFFMASSDFSQPLNASGGWLGLFNETINGNSSNRIVAVEFDTWKNEYDPDYNHVGIDVNRVESKKIVSLSHIAINELANRTLKNGQSWHAWVDYNGETRRLEVFLAYNPDNTYISKPGSPILWFDIDLSKFLVTQNITVGFSASTGTSQETHTIEFWNFSCDYSWSFSKATNSRSPSNGTKSIITPPETHINLKAVLIPVFVSFVILSTFILLWIRRYRNKRNGDPCHQTDMELDECFAQGPHKFSYAELAAATRNFSEEHKLGEGGFGGVYRGILPGTNETLAVKRISQDSKQGKREYVSEVTIISKLRHRNLVQLQGWCHERGDLLLVYEFLPNGSLDKHLYADQHGTAHLGWERRYSIACDVASALVYLHEDWDDHVVHRDVKSSNVMLDSNFQAKLGDFGLARVVERDHGASNTTVIAGTRGYLAPEYVITGKASPESDVFSFGALALEIACGKLPVDLSLAEHNYRVVEWVWDLFGQGKILEAADEKLGGDFKAEEMKRLMAVGLLCSHPDPKSRRTMREVLKILKFEIELPYVPLKLPVAMYHDPLRSHGSCSGTSMTSNSTAASFSSSEPSKSTGASTSLSSSEPSKSTGASKPLLHDG